MGVFCLLLRKGAAPVLEINDGDHARRDVDISRDGEVTVIVMGNPHWLEDPGWVSARDIKGEYARRGAAFMDRLDGFFAVVIHDRVSGRILAATDRYGIYKLFISRSADRLVLSDSVETICRHLPRVNLNATGIVEFVELGHMLGDKTHFKEINTIPPSTVLEMTADLAVVSREYWSVYNEGAGRRAGFDDVIELFNRHVIHGLDFSENASLPLSGGLDSRAILSACLPLKKRVHCYTFGLAGSRDVSLAGRICRELDIPHTCYRFDRSIGEHLPAMTDRVLGPWNGMINSVLLSFQDEFNRRESLHSDLHLPGTGGGLLRSFFIGNIDRSITPDDLAGMIQKRLQINTLKGLFSRALGEDRLLRSSILRELESGGSSDLFQASERFLLRNRVANFSSYAVALSCRHMPAWNPFLYSPLLNRLERVDPRRKQGGALQKQVIEHNSRFLAGIVLDTGQMVTEDPPGLRLLSRSMLFKGTDMSRRIMSKALQETTGRRIIPRRSMFDFAGLLARYQRDYVRETLRHEDMILRDLIDRETLERATDRLLKGSNSVCYGLTNVMSLELWLKRIGKLTTVET